MGLAALVVLAAPLWRVARHGVTLAHEAGHAVVAVLVGRRLTGIRLHADSSGLTVSRGRPRGPGMVLTLLAGHLGPSALGLGAAALLAAGRPVLVLALLVGLLALLLLWVRNLLGVGVVLAVGVSAVAVLTFADPTVRDLVAGTLTWVLLLGSPRTVLELAAHRRRVRRSARARGRAGRGDSDVDQLAALTRVPAVLWTALLLLGTVAAAVLAVRWLLLPA